MGRVSIGTCVGPGDVALVKAAFDAHQIPVLINAEHHANMLGGLGGVLTPLHILVDDARAEEAAALLQDIRAKNHDLTTDAEREADAADDRELAAISADRSERRRRHGTVLVVVLAGAVATPYVIGNPLLSALLVVACLGAIFLTLRGSHEPRIPRAHIKR